MICEQPFWTIETQLAEVVLQLRLFPHGAKPIERKRRRIHPAQQQEILQFAAPERDARKLRGKRGKDHPQVVRLERITLHPLHEKPAGPQSRRCFAIKFRGVKVGDSCHPGIRRFGRNQVVAIASGGQKIPRIIENDMHARISQHAAIERFHERRRSDHIRLDFHAVNALNFRIACQRRERHPASKTDDQRAFRVRV